MIVCRFFRVLLATLAIATLSSGEVFSNERYTSSSKHENPNPISPDKSKLRSEHLLAHDISRIENIQGQWSCPGASCSIRQAPDGELSVYINNKYHLGWFKTENTIKVLFGGDCCTGRVDRTKAGKGIIYWSNQSTWNQR